MQTATNPQTGEKVQWNGSAWVPAGAPAQPGPVTLGTPRPEKPREAPSGYRWKPDGSLEPIPGGPAIKPAPQEEGEDDVKLQQKRASLNSLEAQINRVQQLYDNNLKDEAYGFLSSLGEYLPVQDTRQFNTAGAGLAEQGLSAFRVPGVGAQSDTELRQFVEANRPLASDYDATIEEKLLQLRTRVDATRAEMGLPPAKWAGQEAPEQQVFDGNLGGEQLVRSTNGTRTENDPALAGVRGEYLRRLSAGDTPDKLLTFLREAGVADDVALRKSIAEQYKFRKQNPNVPLSKYNTNVLDDRIVPLSGAESAMNSLGQSAVGAYAMRAGNAVTANNLDSIVGATGGNAERARIALDDAGNNNPVASLAGDLTGGVLAALSGEAGLARAGMAAGVPRALLADTAYGSAAGAGANDANRLQGALTGGLAGAVGSGLGQVATRGLGNVVSGPTDASVRALADQGIPMTVGQAVGRSGRVGEVVKGLEDRMSGLPIVGDVINARRVEGVQAMNAKAFDRALEPIGGNVGGKMGEEAVEEARMRVSDAFNQALRGKAAQLDNQFLGDTFSAVQKLKSIRRDGLGDEIVDQIEEATRGYFDPATGRLTGDNMQALLESLRQIRQAYRADPLGPRIAGEIKRVEKAVEGLFERQVPEVMPEFRAAKQAYRRVSVLADAVNRAKNREGVFTPGQLGMADRANAKKFDGAMNAASGSGQFQDFQRAAQNVLPNEVPDSGTAGRLATVLVPGAIAGSGAGVGYALGDAQSGAAGGVGLATALSLLYSRRGQSLLVNRSAGARAAGEKIKGKARAVGVTTGVTAALNAPNP